MIYDLKIAVPTERYVGRKIVVCTFRLSTNIFVPDGKFFDCFFAAF
ncbi:MAG: hypothetical protein LBC68_13370 [Prevotellaceae bacterium]|jgi:hypothetical protein|nr:hypothetical protein [Prevotellaceae bacterium]